MQRIDQDNSVSGWFIENDGSHSLRVNGVLVLSVPAGATAVGLAKALTLASSLNQQMVFRVTKASGLETDGLTGALAGCDQVLDVTKTEQGATLAFVWDDSAATFRALGATSTGAFVQWRLLPGTTQNNDAFYAGSALKFCQLYFDMGTVQTYTGNATAWEYWTGAAWTALTVHDYTDATAQDGLRSFGRDGAVSFLPPSDWAQVSVNSVTAYWIRVRAGTSANIAVLGITNSKRHYVCSPTDGFVAPGAGTITALALRDEAATAHTAADVKLILFNFTTGERSDELTFPQDKRNDSFAVDLDVSTDDVLGVLITQGDGTNELGPASIELTLSKSTIG